jgi:glycosyltransferase involved in cell wall biosynthesis
MEGFGWFTHEVFQRIANQHPEHEFIFIFDRDFDPSFVYSANVTPVKTGPQARHPWLFYWYFEYAIPRILRQCRADLFVSPDGYMSLRAKTPGIAVVHDLNFEHFPGDLKPHITRYYKKYFPRFVKKADHVITVSEYSKQDIVKVYGTDPAKITVAHNGADEAFTKSDPRAIDGFRRQTGLQQPFFLAVGSIHPRKNITRLLQAFDLFKKNTGSPVQLAIVGNRYLWTPEMENTLQSLSSKNDIVFTGHLSKEDLVKAYSAAMALVFPSYFEGFGIPLVEAMRCECAVTCARATSFPEVAGDAALYFDPFDISDMAEKLREISSSEQLREQLVEKGKQRCLQFNWQNTANIVWQVIEQTARAQKILK